MDVVVRKYYLDYSEMNKYKTKFFITFESKGTVLEIYDQTLYDVSLMELPPYFFLAKSKFQLEWVTLPSEELYDEYVNQWIIKQGNKHKLGEWKED